MRAVSACATGDCQSLAPEQVLDRDFLGASTRWACVGVEGHSDRGAIGSASADGDYEKRGRPAHSRTRHAPLELFTEDDKRLPRGAWLARMSAAVGDSN